MNAAAPKPRKEPLEPGRTVAERYLVTRVLGQGGMGQVLEVEHIALGRAFALKVLRLEKWNDELVRRFNREARALAKVSTPRVAQVTDFGVDGDVGPFYVMELLEGETLEDRLEREERVPAREALAICAELCEALAEVHAAGIVHRDLKPSNVGLPRSGPVGVKLLDFGLAASMDDAFLSKITQSQQILGSLPYMAPEQFNSAEPAPAMDVYAVGIVLYEALTGRLPFLAPSTAAMIHQILSTPPPALPAELPGRDLLEPLLERLLAKETHQRFASAAAAGHALREAGAVLGGPVTRKSGHPPTRVASDPHGPMPPTAEAKAMQPMAFLPTMGMPESSPVVESGTRLSAHAMPAHAMPVMEHTPVMEHGPAMSAPPAHPSFEPAQRGWSLSWLLIGGLGIVLSAAAGVAVVVVLSLLNADEPSDAPPRPTLAAPVVVPVAPPEARPQVAAPEIAPPAEIAAPIDVAPPTETPPAESPREDELRARLERERAERQRARSAVEHVDPPRPPPTIYSPPPPPPPRRGSSGSNGGIIRQW